MSPLPLSVLAAMGPALLFSPQAPPPAPAVHKEKASGVEVQFVNTPWRPAVFQALEEGGPEARSWAFARVLTQAAFTIDEKPVFPGHYVLVLNPRTGGLPMTLEMRRVDNRELFVDVNVMAAPPGGETVYKVPAAFAISTDPTPALDLTLAGWRDGVSLTIRYGNRRLAKDLIRTMP
jgi:hypothetical protein